MLSIYRNVAKTFKSSQVFNAFAMDGLKFTLQVKTSKMPFLFLNCLRLEDLITC